METLDRQEFARSRALLGLLESLEKDGARTQRSMAIQFGVAVGLVNAYLKVCVKKGYVKVRRLPSRRYTYLLTPAGLAEKGRLSLVLLSKELERFRRAREQYSEVFRHIADGKRNQVVLLGACELAEISALCALEENIRIVAIVDEARAGGQFVGAPVVASLDAVPGSFDFAILTEVVAPLSVLQAARRQLGAADILVPAFYGFGPEILQVPVG